MVTDLRARAELAALERLRLARPEVRWREAPAGYLDDWHDNLIEGVTAADFEADLRRGAGNELTDQPDEPAKFRAAFSSSALAVNTFAPFRRRPERLALAGVTGFDAIEFEYPCDNGLVGTNPHFDLFARTATTVIAAESKFLEPLQHKPAQFSEQYAQPFMGTANRPRIVEEPWARMYARLRSDPQTYRHLDAAQLLKHYLGLRHSFATHERTLVYLYWEPTNAADLAVYRDLRLEINDFAAAVAGCDTRFLALSYPSLWREWQQNRSSVDMSKHLERLRQRYAFGL
jgi:hypothetical protein